MEATIAAIARAMSLEQSADTLKKPNTTMTNNFKQIRDLLKFEKDYFYFIQIIQRKKENPELGSNNRVIRSYNISSLEKFDKNKDEIIKLCEAFDARAYIHLNRRKWSKIALECLRHNAELIANEQYDGIKSSFETIIGRNNCEPAESKTWIVDIDTKDEIVVHRIAHIIDAIAKPEGPKIITCIPTKNGYHLITKKFDAQTFNKYLSLQGDIPDIHKDNPTILYAI
jgi:predicted DNA-binding protein (MmcQ/YjbR family)